MSKNLTAKTFNGFKWTGASTVFTFGMQLVYTSVMARLLTKTDFGTMALAMVVLRFGILFAEMGFGHAIIQKKDIIQQHIRAAFTGTMGMGILFFLIAQAIAPLVATFYNNEQLPALVSLMAFTFLINGFSSVSRSLLRRKMNFKAATLISGFSYLLGYIGVGITLAYYDYGVWSLAYAALSQATSSAILSFLVARHSLIPIFSWQYYRPLLAYGSKNSLVKVAEFIGSELDTIVIGKISEESILGIYNRSVFLIRIPVTYFTRSISTVLFPALSSIQTETERLKKVYLLSISYTTFFIFSMCVGIAVAAEPIVMVVLGEKWGDAIPVVRILALAAPFQTMGHFSGVFFDALNLLKTKLIIQYGYLVVLVGFFLALSPFGIVGFAYAILITLVLKNIVFDLILKKRLQYTWAEIGRAYLQGVLSVVITGSIMMASGFLLKTVGAPHLVALIVQMIAGGISLVIVFVFSPSKHLKNMLLDRVENKFVAKEDGSSTKRIVLRIIRLIKSR